MAPAEDTPPTVSVVIPVCNEVENLPILWDELRGVLAGLRRPAEVIFVDDGSTDGSDKVIRSLVESDARVRAVHLAQRSGLSAAFHAGYQAARGAVIVTLDGLAAADAAVSWRQTRHDTAAKRIASRIANGVRRRVLGDQFRDSACSLRAFSRPCLAALPPYDGMHRFVPVLLAKAGHVVVEVPVTHRARRFGRSKFGIRDRAWRAFVDLLAVRWMLARRLPRIPSDPL
jgi:dolichol-phosphate mannosyltransferase